MNIQMEKSDLDKALQLLNDLLEYRTEESFTLVVCGGSGLIVLGLISRSTKDVDIVALSDSNGHLFKAEPLPETIKQAARLVSLELGLPEKWLNTDPSSILDESLPNQGFPAGFKERLISRRYGPRLNVLFLSRYDQIHFKIYAAADKGGPSPHSADLARLAPTDEELIAAVRWAMMQDPSEEFAATLRSMLKALGHTDVVPKI
jgi:hypothetical protein